MKDQRLTIFGLSIVIFTAMCITLAIYLAWRDSTSREEPPVVAEASSPSLANRLATVDPSFLVRPPTVGPSPTTLPTINQAPVESTPSGLDQLPQPEPVTHIVRPGDNLFRISMAYGITVEAIMQANSLANEGLIYTGQALLIPTDTAVSSVIKQNLGAEITPPTATPIPVNDISASPTETPLPPTETPTPAPPVLTTVNGIPLESFLLMPTNVQENARAIFMAGQALGRNPRAFSKVGDSTIENPHFLARFDEGPYNLGEYAYLQGAIDHFAGSHSRQGLAVRRGNHSWTVTDPMWADKSICQPNETPIACEIRVHNPSILIIRLGSNDRGVPSGFEHNLRQVVQMAIDSGVIPVLGTKADRFEGSNINNDIIRQVAIDFQVPLWDYDLLAGTIPGRGLDVDVVHLTTFYAHDYTSPTAFQRGHGLHNLTALMVLDTIWKEIIQGSGE